MHNKQYLKVYKYLYSFKTNNICKSTTWNTLNETRSILF